MSRKLRVFLITGFILFALSIVAEIGGLLINDCSIKNIYESLGTFLFSIAMFALIIAIEQYCSDT